MHIYLLSHKDSYKNRIYAESGKTINSWGARVCFNICIISGFSFKHVPFKHLFLSCTLCTMVWLLVVLLLPKYIKFVINFDKYIISLCSFHMCYWHKMCYLFLFQFGTTYYYFWWTTEFTFWVFPIWSMKYTNGTTEDLQQICCNVIKSMKKIDRYTVLALKKI